VLVLDAHLLSFAYGTPLGDDAVTCGTRLDALAIRPNSLKKHEPLYVALLYKSQDLGLNLETYIKVLHQ
jgi:hypothetical protein